MLSWFDDVRRARIERCEARAHPRLVASLSSVGDLYLHSAPGADYFLRRDGSVWEAFRSLEGGALQWREVEDGDRVAALVLSLDDVPEVAELLPQRPPAAVKCPSCDGADVVVGYRVCHRCAGLGWIVPRATGPTR